MRNLDPALVAKRGLSAFVYREGSAGVKFVNETIKSEGVQGLIGRLPEPLQKLGSRVIEQLPKDEEGELDQASVGKTVTAQSGKAAAVVGSAVSATGSLVFQVVMMLIALYFLLLQGEELVVWMDQAEYRPLKIEYYDRKESLLKTLTLAGYKKYLDKYWRPAKLDMVNHQTGKSTTLTFTDYKFRNGYTERDFDQNSLKSAR